MAVYPLKDGKTLLVDHAHIEKYLGIGLTCCRRALLAYR